MKDIICKCGHSVNAHNGIGCAFDEECDCWLSQTSVLLGRIALLEAVAEASVELRKAINEASRAGVIDHLDAWDDVEDKWSKPLDIYEAALRAAGYDVNKD